MKLCQKKEVLFWLKLYHSCAYECFNLYNWQGRLVGFVPREAGENVEKLVGVGKPSYVRNNIVENEFLENFRYHILIDPKNPNSLKGPWAERFSKILSLSIYNSVGLNTSIFKSPAQVWEYLGQSVNAKSKRILDMGSGACQQLNTCLKGYKLLVHFDCVKPRGEGNNEFNMEGDLYAMPFEIGSFDIELCLFVLEHVTNTKKLIQQVWYTLDENGTLIIAIPIIWVNRTKAKLGEYLINPPFIHLRLFSYEKLHNFPWVTSLDEMERMVIDCGFEKIQTAVFDQYGMHYKSVGETHEDYKQLYSISRFVKKN